MDNTPRSKEFNDVYFSVQDGLAETRHVFLEGNDLPAAWQGKDHFTICETGFGTGLNFLAVWKLFEETAQADQTLHFISFEKFPLSAQEIDRYLEPWRAEFPDHLEALVRDYPQKPGEIQDMTFSKNLRLTLICDDVNAAIPHVNESVDCWFLDGFKPSTNPEMWSETVFENMARLSKKGATFATFTAAGFVRRALQSAGFAVEKVPGFGRKREMLVGAFSPLSP